MLKLPKRAKLGLVVGAVAASACSAAGEAPAEATESDAPPGIEARVVVSRTSSAETEAGEAMAHFAQTATGSKETLAAAGLVEPIPEVGSCEIPTTSAGAAFANMGEVRLLDVGEVTLSAEGDGNANPASISLAPHAFPSISSFASGVVYTSRDRSAHALPSGVDYRIAVSGGSELPGFELQSPAPSELRDVTLGGEPLALVESVSTETPLDVTWRVESQSEADVVTVELTDDQAVRVRCAFADEIGAGTIAADWLRELDGPGRVSVHRQRASVASLPAPEGGTIRVGFDFELNVAVAFTTP